MTSEIRIETISFPNQQHWHGHAFPLVFECHPQATDLDDFLKWIREHQQELIEKAGCHGAILFRGFPIMSAPDFDRVVAAFGLENFPYDRSLSNAVRKNRTERVFTANEAPSEVNIFLHHEMAQTPFFPAYLFFFCEQPATTGGATPLCRSDILLEKLTEHCPTFVENCASKGLLYTNVMPAANDPSSGMGRSWQSTLRADNKQTAEERLLQLRYTWEWLADDCLRMTTPVLPAVKTIGPNRRTFFNQLIAAFQGWKDSRNDPSRAICFGDGSPLSSEDVATAVRLAEELTFDIPWQRGDVALLDNLVVMHGRRNFEGTRAVLASLAVPQTHGQAV